MIGLLKFILGWLILIVVLILASSYRLFVWNFDDESVTDISSCTEWLLGRSTYKVMFFKNSNNK